MAEIKLRAVVRIGELSRELDKAPGARTDKQPLPGSGTRLNRPKADALRSAGISRSAAHRAEQIADQAPVVEAYIAKKSAEGKPVKITEALAAANASERERVAAAALRKGPPPPVAGLHLGDFRHAEIPENSVELIFTDPPYDRESIPLFEDAAKTAARILRPGGSLITYCGQTQLPEALALCAKHLRYWWCAAALDKDSNQRMNRYGVICQWKPLLWFVKGSRGDVQTFVKDVVGGAKEKGSHAWQQSQAEAEHWISALTSPTGLVVDFFSGSGTTLLAAKKLGRPWLGFEIDPSAFRAICERIT